MLIKLLKIIYDAITHSYPEHRVIGEEGHGHDLTHVEGVVWVVDQLMAH